MTLEWKPEYLVGDAFIDTQHQQLFQLANAILVSEDRLEMSEFLFRLFRYVREHFSAEERLMDRRGYAELAAHRALHNKMMEQLSVVVAHANGEPEVYHQEVYSMMRDWILEHIIHCDMRIPKA